MRNCIGLAIVAVWIGACVAASAQSATEKLPPSVATFVKQGQAAADAGNLPVALLDYQIADQWDGGHCASCAMLVARTEAELGDYGNALKDAKRAAGIPTTPAVSCEAAADYAALLTATADYGDPHDKRLQQAEIEFRSALAGGAPESSWVYGLGLVLLREGKDAEGIAELNRFLSLPDAPADFAAEARAMIADPRRAREPIAPAFSFTALDGSTVSSQELRGKVLLIGFWGAWCAPCRNSVAMLANLQRKFQHQTDFVIVSISSDSDQAAWKNFISSHNMTWTQYLDVDGALQHEYDVDIYPTFLVIDRNGVIRFRQPGNDPGFTPGELETAIRQALKQKPAPAAPAN